MTESFTPHDNPTGPDPDRRKSAGRRQQDVQMACQVGQYSRLLKVGQVFTSETNLNSLINLIMVECNRIMNAERSTVFLHDRDSDRLWSFVGTGIEKREIRIPANCGVAGTVFQSRSPLIINRAYDDSRFFSGVDSCSGFVTRNILCIPLFDRKNTCIGVLQCLNKSSGVFSAADLDILTSISHYVAIALGNATIFEELKLMDKAKERIINHLAHELKTPIAIVAGALQQLEKKLCAAGADNYEKTVNRGNRNLVRLLDLQGKIDDILNQKTVAEAGSVRKIVEDAASLVEEVAETADAGVAEGLRHVFSRIESIYGIQTPKPELIQLDHCLNRICDAVTSEMGGRRVRIHRLLGKGRTVQDPSVLEKVFRGLLKNAVENTPDGGKIEVGLTRMENEIRVKVRDWGMGISPANRHLIFVGFIHTQATDTYASKKPFAFNAGGTGADLLRMKVFSERFGFSIAFASRRCAFIPEDGDVCPGDIARCPQISTPEQCFDSGGSTFTLGFKPA